MPPAIASGDGGLLDSAGRQILAFAEYRNLGVLVVLVLLVFVFWRRRRFKKWPGVDDCIYVCTNALAIIGGFVVGVVFLLTRPPAIELLSQQALLTIGIFVPIVSLGYAFPRLRALFSPSTLPVPRTEKPPTVEP
jgi:MFS superfamily sulfate permease-like transporter